MAMIYDNDPKTVSKILKYIEKRDGALGKYDSKGNLTKYVSTCLQQAQDYFKINQKENCIEKLNQAVAYCHEHPNVPLNQKYPFELISNSNVLLNEIEKLYDFYFGLYNKIEELKSSKMVHYWSLCTFVETKKDVQRKSGTVIPIPLLATVTRNRIYGGVFTHLGWVFATDEDLTFLLLPSIITLVSSGPLAHFLYCYCALPHVTEFHLKLSEIQNTSIVDHVYIRNKTVRIMTRETNYDTMIHAFSPLNVLNNTIGDHKELEINNLTFRHSLGSSYPVTDSKKKLQKEFIGKVQSLKN
jgi:hypothetical protein